MDHRDAESAPIAGRPFGRLVASPAHRRPALTRFGLVVLGLAGALGLFLVVGARVARVVRDLVHDQQQYRRDFRAIVLDPPPPSWYAGGSERFLDRVRADAPAWGETVATPEVDLDALLRDFRLYCWVRQARRVTRSYPNRLVIEGVEYREPVARARFANPPELPEVVIDRDGVILPREDLTPEEFGRLIPVFSRSLVPPADAHPGKVWKTGDPAQGREQADPRIVAAARLAEFLKLTVASRQDGDAPLTRIMAIHPTKPHQLFVEFDRMLMVLWGEAPGSESPGEPPPQAKWTLLRAWALRNGYPDSKRSHLWKVGKHPNFLSFSESGVVPVLHREATRSLDRDRARADD